MKNILLTSTGLTNRHIKEKFLGLLNKDINKSKALFVITAAIDPDAIRMLPTCLDNLTECGIIDQNITVYNMHELLNEEEILKYDIIYVCGGETKYLVKRMNEINFKQIIDRFVDNGGIYLGVSAGAVCAGSTYEGGLGLIRNKIKVHCESGSNNGEIIDDNEIFLTNDQAIYIDDNNMTIFDW